MDSEGRMVGVVKRSKVKYHRMLGKSVSSIVQAYGWNLCGWILCNKKIIIMFSTL